MDEKISNRKMHIKPRKSWLQNCHNVDPIDVTDEAVHVERKPLQKLSASRTHRYRGHEFCWGADGRMPDGSRSHNRKKLSGCAHTVEMWSRLWMRSEKIDGRKLTVFQLRHLSCVLAFFSRDIASARIFIGCLSDHLQKRPDFCSQRAMTRMNYIQAAP